MGIYSWLVIILLGFLFILSPTVRCAFCNPFKFIKNAIIDIINYFKYKKWREAPFGFVECYTAMDAQAFGCGKTLTSVRKLCKIYEKYNDKMVWNPETKKWVKQKIVIFSMVKFKHIPYIKLVSMQQYISYLHERYEKDKEEDIMTVTYCFVDEAGSVFNSRSFKENFDPLSIKTLLTSRHFRAAMILTAQRFSMCDALLRQVTNRTIACDKLWRLQRINYYDAYEMENATNPLMVKPYKRACVFITNRDYDNYNTYELLEDIEKKCKEGDMLTEAEILQNQCNLGVNTEGIMKPSKKFLKKNKKMNK